MKMKRVGCFLQLLLRLLFCEGDQKGDLGLGLGEGGASMGTRTDIGDDKGWFPVG